MESKTAVVTGLIASIVLIAANVQAGSIDSVERASRNNDLTALETQRSAIVDADTPYLAALADYRIGIAHSVRGDETEAGIALTAASEQLDVLVKAEPKNAEAWALLANVYGMRMGLSPFSAMKLAGQADRARAKARALAPANPRVLLTEGISLYNTPGMWGGSKPKAIAVLDQAIAAFEATPDSGWGFAEALVWRGLAHAETGDTAAAERDFKRAVELEPDYAWAQSLLARQRAVASN
ncbi:MAG: tetratricopeptide repeat protein [Pseudomonadota bacterium]